ncbi:hypothetical protein JOQ06_016976, partial [Pogonophryne albipinna]
MLLAAHAQGMFLPCRLQYCSRASAVLVLAKIIYVRGCLTCARGSLAVNEQCRVTVNTNQTGGRDYCSVHLHMNERREKEERTGEEVRKKEGVKQDQRSLGETPLQGVHRTPSPPLLEEDHKLSGSLVPHPSIHRGPLGSEQHQTGGRRDERSSDHTK